MIPEISNRRLQLDEIYAEMAAGHYVRATTETVFLSVLAVLGLFLMRATGSY